MCISADLTDSLLSETIWRLNTAMQWVNIVLQVTLKNSLMVVYFFQSYNYIVTFETYI